ncbi:MAG TPA: DUF2267 domain-containing protein [Jiangellaceae bacterium]|nr:DUF2267 domain-containing protein [Jiangellaceae bacterium]
MRYDEFVAEVRDRGQYLDQDQAERAVKAVLTVLGERLVGGEPKDLAGQLPGDLSEFLLKRADQEESYGVDGFIDRVAEELSGATAETARQDATAVLTTLAETVTAGEFTDVLAQLPREYTDLLDSMPDA